MCHALSHEVFFIPEVAYCDRVLPVVSYFGVQSLSFVFCDVTRGRFGRATEGKRTEYSGLVSLCCGFSKMNVFRTCKQLSRLGQTTVSFFISLTLVRCAFLLVSTCQRHVYSLLYFWLWRSFHVISDRGC